MSTKGIQNLKVARLLVSIVLLCVVIFYALVPSTVILPKEELVLSLCIAIMVFLLGLQYRLEKKDKMLTFFLIIFSIWMFAMSIVGFYF